MEPKLTKEMHNLRALIIERGSISPHRLTSYYLMNALIDLELDNKKSALDYIAKATAQISKKPANAAVKKYFILDDGQPQDGEFYTDKEKLFRAVEYAEPSAKIYEMSFGERRLTDVTEDIVDEGYIAGYITREAKIVSEYVHIPMSRDDYLANEADNKWKMREEPA